MIKWKSTTVESLKQNTFVSVGYHINIVSNKCEDKILSVGILPRNKGMKHNLGIS